MEEIFGEIEDEHDEIEDVHEEQTEEGIYLFSAKLEVDYLNEKYDLEIPDGDYETLGGFVIANLENIPTKDEVFIIDKFEVKIIEATELRIEKVELLVLD